MSFLSDPANAKFVASCLLVACVFAFVLMSATLESRPAVAAGASIANAGLTVLIFAFVANIPHISYASLAAVVVGMVMSVVFALACIVNALCVDRIRRPKSAPVRQRIVTSDDDGPFARLVRSSTWSTEIGHPV
jgi:hypothetical protein